MNTNTVSTLIKYFLKSNFSKRKNCGNITNEVEIEEERRNWIQRTVRNI